MTTYLVDVSQELAEFYGPEQDRTDRVRQTLVLDLLRNGQISQGKAAQMLGITRGDIIDLMSDAQIPSGPTTIDELNEEIADIRHLLPGA